jgi:hypothetical protein
MYSIEMELNIVLQPLLYLNTTEVQYSLCTVLMTVRLAAMKAKFITELAAIRDRTVTKNTELKERVLSCLMIVYCAAV